MQHVGAAPISSSSEAKESANPTFVWACRVYWEDTDAGGVVYYANYLKFMERARTEWLRGLGFSQTEMQESLGGVFVVRHCELDYLHSARLDDYLEVQTTLIDQSATTLTMLQTVHRLAKNAAASQPPTLLCSGRVRLVWLDKQAWRPQKIPQALREHLVS
jgi:acyl-CoA thioester hydrolase